MIRQIKTKDIRPISDIWLKISIEKYAFVCEQIGISPRDFWSEKLPEMIQMALEEDGYVYQVHDQIQGFLTIRPKNSCGFYVSELFVDSPWQGKGIVGETLINHAKSLGSHIETSAYQKADWAVRFYEKHGFVKKTVEARSEKGTNQNKFDLIWQNC